MNKPQPQDEIAVDTDNPTTVWHRPPNAPWLLLQSALQRWREVGS